MELVGDGSNVSDSQRTRTLTRQSTLGVAALLAVALCLLVNYFGWKYFARWDWTQSSLYSLSEKSENILAELDQDIAVTMFVDPEAAGYQQAKELLSRYEAASSRISVVDVDPARDLARAQELMQQGAVNVVIFDSGEAQRMVETDDLIEYDYSGMQFGEGPTIKGFKGEQEFTAAILGLAEGRRRVVALTRGHGEADVDDPSGAGLTAVKTLLERDNFEVVAWESLADPSVPSGTELLVVAGPKIPFTPPEADAIASYLDSGGRLLAMIDPQFSPLGGAATTGLEQVLAANGVELGADIVVDPSGAVPFFGAETLFAGNFGDHPATRTLEEASLNVILPLAQSVAATEVEGLRSETLIQTTDDGWGERDLEHLDQVQRDESDRLGPVALAIAVEVESESELAAGGESFDAPGELSDSTAESTADAVDRTDSLRMVVIGDSEFATDNQIGNSGNAFLFSNLVNWLAERDAAVAIPPRTPEQTRLNLTQNQMAGARWLTVVLVPLTVLVAGFAVYRRRRR